VCGLVDLGYTGISWTFEKKVVGGTFCRVRLDRALASPSWCARYPLAEVKHLAVVATSDHILILLSLEPVPASSPKPPPIFRYETMWEAHADFDQLIKQVWTDGEMCFSARDLKEKLASISSLLTSWGRSTFGHVRTEIRNRKRELESLRRNPHRTGPSFEEIKVTERLVELQGREEKMWRQRSRIQWLSEGDKNTHFFHQRASQRRKKNKISILAKADGSVTEDPIKLQQMARSFYADLYTSEATSGMDEVLASVLVSVTADMNAKLIAPFRDNEIKEALFQMYPTKAPGPHFFQKHWDLCGGEVTCSVLHVLRGEDNPESINKTFIVLIPKVAQPEDLGKFRPISLCNAIYKIASKVLANRLKAILPDIILEEQSAFVPGRMITDNIITAYECLHFMKRNGAKKHQQCALKLDMRKAYDRVEWNYLQAIMQRMGFHDRWVQLIMKLISSVSFLVLFNGTPLEEFRPTRGIRQGDPISPYLFLIAAEGLSGLLKQSCQSSHLRGIQVAPTAPTVNHLLFADDSLLFVKASEEGAQEAKTLLDKHCEASG
jgi:hypothetical protein